MSALAHYGSDFDLDRVPATGRLSFGAGHDTVLGRGYAQACRNAGSIKPGFPDARAWRCLCIQSRHAREGPHGSPAAGAGSSVDASLKCRVALNDGPVSIAPESINLHRACL